MIVLTANTFNSAYVYTTLINSASTTANTFNYVQIKNDTYRVPEVVLTATTSSTTLNTIYQFDLPSGVTKGIYKMNLFITTGDSFSISASTPAYKEIVKIV